MTGQSQASCWLLLPTLCYANLKVNVDLRFIFAYKPFHHHFSKFLPLTVMQTSSCYVHSLSAVTICKIRKQLCATLPDLRSQEDQAENRFNSIYTSKMAIRSHKGNEPKAVPQSQEVGHNPYLGLD